MIIVILVKSLDSLVRVTCRVIILAGIGLTMTSYLLKLAQYVYINEIMLRVRDL